MGYEQDVAPAGDHTLRVEDLAARARQPASGEGLAGRRTLIDAGGSHDQRVVVCGDALGLQLVDSTPLSMCTARGSYALAMPSRPIELA